MRDTEPDRPWHKLDPDGALEALESRRSGLSGDEAAQRLERYGPNTIREDTRVSPWKVLLDQFTSPLIYVLLASLVVTLAIQRWSDATVIGLVLVVNATVGFFQEFRAENAIRALMEMVAPGARVRRDGETRKVRADEIVPGDVALLGEGEIVPADMRLIESRGLQINESTLTGESVPAGKVARAMEDADEDLPPADVENMAYMGTAVTSGHALGVVTATGAATEVGQIAESIRTAGTQKSPIQRRMDRLAKALAVGISLVAAIAFGVGLLIGESVEDMFLLAVALAVAAMPAGLPVVMTVALAVGVRRMVARHAVIRHLPAVETLGSCTVILSDKTGTLTRNQMTVREISDTRARVQVSGPALRPTGEFTVDGENVDPRGNEALGTTLLVAALNNGATLRERDGEREEDEPDEPTLEPSGDPMEVALLVAARKAGLDRDRLLEEHPQIDEVPFQTERRFSASIHEDRDSDGPLVCVKGAPEVMIEMCDDRLDDRGGHVELRKDDARAIVDDMAASGLRTLAMAIGRGDDAARSIKAEEPRGFTLTGLCGLLDPPRDSAVTAVESCHNAGIRVIMVTGDHARTAAAIGHKVKVDRPVPFRDTEPARVEPREEGSAATPLPETRTGREIAGLSDEDLDDTIERINVFARFKPEQKLRLVRRLKHNGEIVAVTGDGVNDAPALKEADLGAAMGRAGTDVAKEASDMVITDDNFASVYGAVEEGRTAFRNIRMATFFLLSTGAADVLIILVAMLSGWPIPLLPAQILWCNVVTNGIADVALGFEPGERSLFRRPPRPPGEGILNRPLLERLVVIGLWLTAGVLGVFYWLHFVRDTDIDQARVAALTTLVLFQKVHVFNCRSEHESIFRKSLLANKVLFVGVMASLAVHIAAMYIPWTQELISLEPLNWETWLVMIGIAATAIIPNELHKWLVRRREARDG